MIIYLDVLIVLNLFVNYFIILATKKFLRRNIKLWRILLGSFIGALFSLYIFLPSVSSFVEISIKIFMCFTISVISFGIKDFKNFLKSSGVLFLVTCAYAGVMIAVWKIFKPYGMVINNSVVYFDISPINIVVFSVVSYFIFLICLKIFGRNSFYAKECEITVFYKDKKSKFKAIVDTGNSVCDIFGSSQVIIVDKSVVNFLFPSEDYDNKTRYRAIPYSSVTSSGILDGYRCDCGIAYNGDKKVNLKSPIIAVSNTPLEDFSGIVNPQIFE